MAFYDGLFDSLGLREWCNSDKTEAPVTLLDLLNKAQGGATERPWWEIPFPSLDNLNKSCDAVGRTRDFTGWVETFFLDVKDGLKFVLDPLTQPLSWLIDGALAFFVGLPWWVLIPAILVVSFFAARKVSVTIFVAVAFALLAFIDHYTYAVQTLSIIFVCTILSILMGVPIGIGMSRSNGFQRTMIPVLDMLQTLPSFVYLIPLIFLFSITESKLYGIAIILYAIVPVIRLTDLGIRLVDKDVLEAADAFGMTSRQKLLGVQLPLAMPNIMAGVNQTIMMALSIVVIASLVSAPGLGTLVLRGIRNLELGVGIISGLCIVVLAAILDRVSKASLARINAAQNT
jgi:glycine betaine/proline transport system permease protein